MGFQALKNERSKFSKCEGAQRGRVKIKCFRTFVPFGQELVVISKHELISDNYLSIFDQLHVSCAILPKCNLQISDNEILAFCLQLSSNQNSNSNYTCAT